MFGPAHNNDDTFKVCSEQQIALTTSIFTPKLNDVNLDVTCLADKILALTRS